LIEASGTGNAVRFARHFGLLPGHSEKFSPWAELHQAVCVVDALDFFRACKQSSARRFLAISRMNKSRERACSF
jgi:G3E family GTPase